MKSLVLLLSFSISLFPLIAQDYVEEEDLKDEEKTSFADRIIIDGNVVLQFGTATVLGANPQIGYRITDGLSAGIGYSYNHFSYKYTGGQRVKDKLYGPTAFANAVIQEDYFLRADYQKLKYAQISLTDADDYELNLDRLYLGGGLNHAISDKFSVYVGVFVDLLAPSLVPVYRGGVAIGLGR